MAITDLAELVDSFRRETNADATTVTDDVVTGHLADAFWRLKLENLMAGYEITTDYSVSPVTAIPDVAIPDSLGQLIVIEAGCKYLRNQIMAQPTGFRAHAGPVEFEESFSATALANVLEMLMAAKSTLVEQIRAGEGLDGSSLFFVDGVSARYDAHCLWPEQFPS